MSRRKRSRRRWVVGRGGLWGVGCGGGGIR